MTVKYNFEDFSTIVQHVVHGLADQEKSQFVEYAIAEMEQMFLSTFRSSSKIVIGGLTVCRNWFVNVESDPEKYRDYLILANDNEGGPLLYCVYCVAFSNKSYALCKTGLQIGSGKAILTNIKRHESAEYHYSAVEKYRASLVRDTTTDSCSLIDQNRYVVVRVIQAVISVSSSGNYYLCIYNFILNKYNFSTEASLLIKFIFIYISVQASLSEVVQVII